MVVDASAVAAWYLPSQATPSSERLLARLHDYDCVAPSLFEIEIRNVMLLAERRKAQSAGDTGVKLVRIFGLITVRQESVRDAAARCLSLARATGLKLYDAIYLDLALAERRPLASRDTRLVEAAVEQGVDVLDLRG